MLNRCRSSSSIPSEDYSYALDPRQTYLKRGLRAQSATAEKAWQPPTPITNAAISYRTRLVPTPMRSKTIGASPGRNDSLSVAQGKLVTGKSWSINEPTPYADTRPGALCPSPMQVQLRMECRLQTIKLTEQMSEMAGHQALTSLIMIGWRHPYPPDATLPRPLMFEAC
jgi:hypothetical protein